MPSVNVPYHPIFSAGFTGVNNPGGIVFYVAPSGYTAVDGKGASNNNSGRTPQQPFSTIQNALDNCVSGRGDQVLLLPGSYTVTAAITMTKADVTLASALPVGPREHSPVVIVNATDVNTIEINADNCSVIGIEFDDNVAASTADGAVIAVNTANTATDYYRTKIINCYLDMLGSDVDRDGIALGLAGDATDGAIFSLVEGCVILDCDQDAIVIATGSDYSVVRNCLIYDMVNLTRFGIEVVGASAVIEGCDILVSGTACINNGLAASRLLVQNCRLHAWGADTFGIVAIATATQRTAANWITATAAGNTVDYTTDNTSPSADAFISNIFAASAGATALGTSTDDGA